MTSAINPALDLAAFALARDAYLAAARGNSGPSAVVQAVLEAYLPAIGLNLTALKPVKRLTHFSDRAKALAELAVGEELTWRDVYSRSLRNWYAGARRILGNAGARWSSRIADDGAVIIQRQPDGSSRRDPRRNALAVRLAALEVGDSRLIDCPNPCQHRGVTQNAKLQARRILNDHAADWSFKQTSKGIRVTRLSPDPVKADLRTLRVPSDVQRIARQVMARHGVTAADLVDRGRTAHLSGARHEFVGRVHELKDRFGEPRYSLIEIARFIERENHSTVLNSIARWTEMKAQASTLKDAA